MSCKYSYRKNKHDYLTCAILQELCPLVRYCGIKGEYINTDNYDTNCRYYIQKERTVGMTQDKPNKVLFEKRGFLYVELNDELGQVITVKNTFDEVPKYVKLYKKDGVYCAK